MLFIVKNRWLIISVRNTLTFIQGEREKERERAFRFLSLPIFSLRLPVKGRSPCFFGPGHVPLVLCAPINRDVPNNHVYLYARLRVPCVNQGKGAQRTRGRRRGAAVVRKQQP